MSQWPEYPFPWNPSRLTPLLYAPYTAPVAGYLGTLSSGAWPASNKAIYIPFRINDTVRLGNTSGAIFNGSATSGNGDFGIYAQDGRRIRSSGSVSLSAGANTTQNFVLGGGSSWVLPAGVYYLGIAINNTTHQLQRFTPGIQQLRAMGVLEEASGFPLPATTTFAQISSNYIPTTFVTQVPNPSIHLPLKIEAMPTIHTYSWESIGGHIISRLGSRIDQVASAAWPGSNWACLIPFTLGARTRFQRAFVFNGATAVGNIDSGIYTYELNLIASTGSTAQSGTNTLQVLNLDVTLGPGRFYMALAMSSGSATVFRATATDSFGSLASETLWGDTSFPLPSTFVINQFPNPLPVIGLAKGTVI